MENIIIGIDLGTTNSVVSILKEKETQTILVDGKKLLPSVVSLTNEGFVIGQTAKNMAILEPEKTVLSVKRLMGQDIELSVGDKKMRPEEVSALILKKMRQSIIDEFNLNSEDVIRAVITVPAYFTEEQRAATKQAAELANLKVERIINEPTAAALAFGLSQMDEAIYAIYDFGGGTFDVSIIESNEGLVEVLASTGNNELGGDDLDELLAEYIWQQFITKNKLKDAKKSNKENARLQRIAEQTKIKLSTENEVEIQESFFFKDKATSYHLELNINRADFTNLIESKIQETIDHLKQAITEAKLSLEEIDGIVLVGGSSRIPLISQRIEDQIKIVPMLIDLPDEAVSHGASIQGAIIDKLDINTVLVDITPHSLGVGAMDELTYESRLDTMMGTLGLGQSLEEAEKQLNLGAFAIITKNTPIPVKRQKLFSASTPYQKAFKVEVYQGENDRLRDNKIIGESLLEVKKPIENGEIEVTFELDINGLLKVTAVETTTKEEVHAEFKSSRGMKMKKAKLEEQDNTLKIIDNASLTLIKRAKDVLENKELNEEDATELKQLIDNYQSQKQEQQIEDAAITETELMDLLYYLEQDEN